VPRLAFMARRSELRSWVHDRSKISEPGKTFAFRETAGKGLLSFTATMVMDAPVDKGSPVETKARL
jgi:hypothetical protein